LEYIFVVGSEELIPILELRGALIVTLPAPVAEMFADKRRNIPVPHEIPLTVIEPVLVVTLDWCILIPMLGPLPMIVTLPPSVAEMFVSLLVENIETPMNSDPVVHAVPLTVIDPKLVVTLQDLMATPVATDPVPLAAVPLIIRSPEYVETKPDITTPTELSPVPHEVPLNVSEPVLVMTLAEFTLIPCAAPVDPFPLTPVIDTQPDPPACTLDDVKITPAPTKPLAPRPSMVIFPLVVLTFTVDPLMQTPSNAKEPT
jgi:hypothetical protein